MTAVARWSAGHACALRTVLEETQVEFASRLGVSVRTVAYWDSSPDRIPSIEMQAALDRELSQVASDVRERFVVLVNPRPVCNVASPDIPSMKIVGRWTGSHARALRDALRDTQGDFAARLGVSVRTVAYWDTEPGRIPNPELQQALDTALSQSSIEACERFAGLVGVSSALVPVS